MARSTFARLGHCFDEKAGHCRLCHNATPQVIRLGRAFDELIPHTLIAAATKHPHAVVPLFDCDEAFAGICRSALESIKRASWGPIAPLVMTVDERTCLPLKGLYSHCMDAGVLFAEARAMVESHRHGEANSYMYAVLYSNVHVSILDCGHGHGHVWAVHVCVGMSMSMCMPVRVLPAGITAVKAT